MSVAVVLLASRPRPEMVIKGTKFIESGVIANGLRLKIRSPLAANSLLPAIAPKREILMKPQPAQIIPLGLAMINSAFVPAIST